MKGDRNNGKQKECKMSPLFKFSHLFLSAYSMSQLASVQPQVTTCYIMTCWVCKWCTGVPVKSW